MDEKINNVDLDHRIILIQKSLTNITPRQNAINRIENIRDKFKKLVVDICYNSPEGREQDIGIQKLEESLMWIIKGIVLNDNREEFE